MAYTETQVLEADKESKKEDEVETSVAEVHQMPLVATESKVPDAAIRKR